jgi:hypothetical protein
MKRPVPELLSDLEQNGESVTDALPIKEPRGSIDFVVNISPQSCIKKADVPAMCSTAA